MSNTHLIPLEPGNRIQLPADWVATLGLRGLVALDWTSSGILIRRVPPTTWDDLFATKLAVGSARPQQTTEAPEETGDDLLF
jgi:hypothetical protein